jgi:hypothetical protein
MAIIYADSLSPTDVQIAMDAATEGDTIVLPSGTANWTSSVTWDAPANVTLKGAGTSELGGGDQTIIIDDYDSTNRLLLINVANTGLFRMTGITFRPLSISPFKENGIIVIGGPGNIRIDHCHFDHHTSPIDIKPLWIGNGIYGVVDHCLMDFVGNTAIYIANGPVDDLTGDSTWAAPTDFGGADFIFFENNHYRATTSGPTRIGDVFSAGRVVWRFNTLTGSAGLEVHATGHALDDRGARACEGYCNYFEALEDQVAPPYVMSDASSGTMLLWGNTTEPENLKNGFVFKVTRGTIATYLQLPPPDGWGFAGPAPRATGTVNVSGDSVTWVSGDTFDTDWPADTIIYITDAVAEGSPGQGPALGPACAIGTVNSSTSITLLYGGHTGGDLTGKIYYVGSPWDGNTDEYGYPAIDQPGRGQGDLLTGYFPAKVNDVTGIASWPNQALEPIYTWNNEFTPHSGYGGVLYGADARVVANRDYYPQASGIQTTPSTPFDGTEGVGWGTLANRPTTCTAGVAYFAIDEGIWNQTDTNEYGVQMNGTSGVLYKATATDTWERYYEPFTYPHPFIAENVILADSPNFADAEAAIDLAVDGDTVIIPPGTATWTTKLEIDKAITLKGSGIGQTVIRDGVVGDSLMLWTLVAGNISRMTGIEFNDNGRSGNIYCIRFFGNNTDGSRLRVDNCRFDHLLGFSVVVDDCLGVIHDNEFLFTPTNIPIYVFHKHWNGGEYANKSWEDDCNFGTENFLFVEDNIITSDSAYAAVDSYGGSRIVFRHNTLTNCYFEVHGTDSAGIFRGGRAFEIYSNTFTGPTLGAYIVNGRSGTFIIYDNEVYDNEGAKISLVYYRAAYPFSPWGPMTGYNEWDDNDPLNPISEEVADSGTSNGGIYASPTVTVTGAGWTPNQWTGYVIYKTSTNSSPQKASLIHENTEDTITYFKPGFTEDYMLFESGDTFEINRVIHALDQPGRGQGTMVVATDPPTPPIGWNDQITEPTYAWNNDGGEETIIIEGYPGLIREDEHFFNNTEAPGYTPYTYPHPLRAGEESVADSVTIGIFNVTSCGVTTLRFR